MQLSSAQPQRAVFARLSAPPALAVIVMLGLLMALAAGAIAISRGFDGLYGQDAYAYFDYGTVSVRNSIGQLKPLEAFFWPPGYPLLVALTSFLVGPTPLAGQLVSLLMGALVPVFTGLLALELWPEDPLLSLLAAGFVTMCGQLWQSSVVVMSDTTGLALATFSAWALARYARTERGAWLAAAGAAIAYATLARWIYGVVALPFGLYALTLVCRRSLPSLDGRTPTKISLGRHVTHAVLALALAVVILAPVVGAPLVGLLTEPSSPAAFAGNFQVYSWSPLNALHREFFTADGHLAYNWPNGVYYGVAPANLAFFGPLVAVWILPGLWIARQWPKRNIILIAGWAAIVFAFHAGAPWQNFRFTLAYLPPLAILAAAGVRFVWGCAKLRPAVKTLVAIEVALGLLIGVGAGGRLVERFIDAKDQELALVRWVQSQTPRDAQLFSFGPTLAFRHYSSLTTYDLYDVTPADIQAILTTPGPDFVLVDRASIEGQWLNQSPWTNFHLLRDSRGLAELGTAGGYTLYQVATPPT